MPDLGLAAYVLTCADRLAILDQTLASFRATDWGSDPIIQADTGAHPIPRASRINANWLRVLNRIAAGPPRLALVLEDDIEINAHLRHNLSRWAPLAVGGPFLGTLYNGAQTTNPHAMWGSQGLVISPEIARFAIDHWNEEEHLSDTRIPRLASRITTVHVHSPSLVQHVGAASTWGAAFHQAPDFDRNWRAP